MVLVITQRMGLNHVHYALKENIKKIMNNISVLNVLLVRQLDIQELLMTNIVLTKVWTLAILKCDVNHYILGQIQNDYTAEPFPMNVPPEDVPGVPSSV